MNIFISLFGNEISFLFNSKSYKTGSLSPFLVVYEYKCECILFIYFCIYLLILFTCKDIRVTITSTQYGCGNDDHTHHDDGEYAKNIILLVFLLIEC